MQQMGIERKGMPKQKGKKIKSERRKRREVKKEGKRRKGNEEKKREREVRKKNIKMKMRRGGKKTFFPAFNFDGRIYALIRGYSLRPICYIYI